MLQKKFSNEINTMKFQKSGKDIRKLSCYMSVCILKN